MATDNQTDQTGALPDDSSPRILNLCADKKGLELLTRTRIQAMLHDGTLNNRQASCPQLLKKECNLDRK